MRGLHGQRGTTTGRWMLAGLAAAVLGAWPAAGQTEGRDAPTAADITARVRFPWLRIPFTAKPPAIDGRMDPGEWEDSAAYSGYWQDYSFNTFLYLATTEKHPTFWVSYDKEYVYFAHRSPVFPKGAWLIARGKYEDVIGHPEYGVLWDDHIEFQMLPSAAPDPPGFFKWLCNPIHTPVDYYRSYIPNQGDDMEWDSGFDLEGHWDDETWTTEMRIPIRSLQYADYAEQDGKPSFPVPIPDGTIWRHWGSRAIGGVGGWSRLFSATTPGGWTCNSMRWIFDSQGVSAQVERLGRLFRDKIDLSIQLKNHGERSETVRVGFFIENSQELIVANEEDEFVELLPGEVKPIRIVRDKIGITPQGNALWLDIRTLSGKMVYQSILIPFHHLDGLPGFKEHFIDGMKFSREPRKPFQYTFAYLASVNKLHAVVDTDIYGVTDEGKTGVEAKVTLMTEEGETIQEMMIPLAAPLEHPDAKTFGGRRGEAVMEFPRLKPGHYKTVCLLYDANKKIVGEQETIPFEEKRFPWEGNTEGLEDTVPDPYQPLTYEAGGPAVESLMHRFLLEPSGMPKQITIKDRTRNPNFGDQLRGPVRFEATAGGARFGYEATAPLTPVREWQSELAFETAGRIGPLQTRSRVQYDFDGWLTYDLHYASPQPVDTLEFVFELAGPADILAHHDGQVQLEALAREGPVVWNSRDHRRPAELFYGNFTPWIQLGNGDRCFIWVCETDRDMRLLAENEAARIEKTETGEYTLRVFFVNEPGPIPEEKHVTFALVTLPGKPQPPAHRRTNWHPEPIGGGPKMSDGASSYSIHMNHEEDYALFQPKPIQSRAYTTANVICFDMPAVRGLTFTGEFMGRTDIQPNPDLRGQKPKHPVTGRPNDTIFLNTDVGWRWCPSKVDCAVYWRSKQIRLGQLQGHWWDHSFFAELDLSPVLGNRYRLPEHKFHAAGHMQHGYHMFLPRQFFKRLARIHKTAGVASTSGHYGGAESALAACYLRDQVHWEASASYSGDNPHMKEWPLPIMRFYACNYTGLNGYIIHDVNYTGDQFGIDPWRDRGMLAAALLNDVGSLLGRHACKYTWHRIEKALEEFGFYDEGDAVEFIPYWRSQAYYRYGLGTAAEDDALESFLTEAESAEQDVITRIIVSFYRHRQNHTALVVLGNPTATPLEENLFLSPDLLGHPVKACRDVEVGEELPFMRDPKYGNSTQTRYTVPNTFAPLFVDRYQFRLLQVE